MFVGLIADARIFVYHLAVNESYRLKCAALQYPLSTVVNDADQANSRDK